MTDLETSPATSRLAAVSNAMVTLHKQQFGRGPTRARTHFAGDDTLICVLEEALLPAERAMVEIGEAHRVEEQRLYFQNATARQFIAAIEEIMGREVWSFASACDAANGVVTEIYHFSPAAQ